MSLIFISYRRAETAEAAGRICDHLKSKFGTKAVFLDVEDDRKGQDFRTYIRHDIERCDVMLVVIGDHWLRCTNEDGSRRLDDSQDNVRIEVEMGLATGKPVIPVLVGKASMPGEEALPETIRTLAHRNATEVRAGTAFAGEMAVLVRAIRKAHGGFLKRVLSGRAGLRVYLLMVLLLSAVLLSWVQITGATGRLLSGLSARCGPQEVRILQPAKHGFMALEPALEAAWIAPGTAAGQPDFPTLETRGLWLEAGEASAPADLRLVPYWVRRVQGQAGFEAQLPTRLASGQYWLGLRYRTVIPGYAPPPVVLACSVGESGS